MARNAKKSIFNYRTYSTRYNPLVLHEFWNFSTSLMNELMNQQARKQRFASKWSIEGTWSGIGTFTLYELKIFFIFFNNTQIAKRD